MNLRPSHTHCKINRTGYFILIVLLNFLILFGNHSNVFAQKNNTDIRDFSFPEESDNAVINYGTVDIEVEYGTDLTGLIAKFSLSKGANAYVNGVFQESGVTPNDFTNPVIYTVVASNGITAQNWIVTVHIAPNSATDFLSYSFPEQTEPAIIDTERHRIDIKVAYGTDVTNLVATFELSYGAIARVNYFWIQISGVTSNDFTEPVTYSVIAEDGITRQNWRVNVTVVPYPGTDITSYNIPGQASNSIINPENHTVDLEMPFGTDLTNLISTFTLSYNATAAIGNVSQISGVTPNDFTNPLIYTITAYDEITVQDWTVTVEELPNDQAEILSFSFPEETEGAVIDSRKGTIDIEVVFGTDLSSLIASFTLSPQASASIEGIDQISGITVNDFSSPVSYVVTAGNNTLKGWTVTVTEALNSENDFLTYSLPGQYGEAIIDTVNHSIEIELPYTNELDNLIATFTLSPQAVSEVDGLIQESGITPNDFSDVVTYTVIAGDQSRADWNVLVSVLPNNETDILTFNFDEQAGPALIDPENHSINIEVKYGTVLSDLVAIFTLSPYANAYIGSDQQESGVSINDFSNPVIYTILAGDNTTIQDWEISVSVKPPSIETDFLSFSLNEEIGQKVIDTVSHEILIMVAEGTQLDKLVASFSLSEGATAYVDDVVQISGVTINDFSDHVIYTIIAEDNITLQTWTVIVSIAFDFFYIKEPLSFPVNNESVEISARAPQYESIEKVLLHYRKIEAQQWSVLDVFGIQGVYRVDVLRNMVGNSGMFYFFSATDTSGNILLLDYNHLVIHYDMESPQIPGLRFGGTVNQYQIISIPLNLQNPNAEEVFNELGEYNIKQWRLFHHDGISTKEYKNGFTNIDPGLGFWLIIRNQTSITTGEGYTVRIDSTNGFEIDLKPGWNQIGNPFDMDISWDNVILDNNNLNIGRIKLFYRDTLTEASVIPRFRGGFVFLEGVQPVTAKVRPSQVGWNARKQPYVDTDRLNSINQGNWIAGLSVSNGTVTNTVSGIGMHPEAVEGKDRYDEVLLPVPKEIIPFELAFNHPFEKYRKFGVDVVQSTDQYIWEFEVKSFNPSQSLTISWDNTYFGNNEYKLILNHVGPEALINMKDMNSYTFNANEIEQFRIVFGNDAFIKDMLKPQSITFSNGYPNPFRDQMTIPFTLPDRGSDYNVSISVYDLTGNMIKMMTNKNYSSGYYAINLNTLDSPEIFSSGIYLIKMEVRSDKINTVLSQKVIKQ